MEYKDLAGKQHPLQIKQQLFHYEINSLSKQLFLGFPICTFLSLTSKISSSITAIKSGYDSEITVKPQNLIVIGIMSNNNPLSRIPISHQSSTPRCYEAYIHVPVYQPAIPVNIPACAVYVNLYVLSSKIKNHPASNTRFSSWLI